MGKAGPREATLRASSSTFGRICSAILLTKKNAALYPADHPVVGKSIEALRADLLLCLQETGEPFTLDMEAGEEVDPGLSSGKLPESIVLQRLLRRHLIRKASLSPEATSEELFQFCYLLRDDLFKNGGGFEGLGIEPGDWEHIQLVFYEPDDLSVPGLTASPMLTAAAGAYRLTALAGWMAALSETAQAQAAAALERPDVLRRLSEIRSTLKRASPSCPEPHERVDLLSELVRRSLPRPETVEDGGRAAAEILASLERMARLLADHGQLLSEDLRSFLSVGSATESGDPPDKGGSFEAGALRDLNLLHAEKLRTSFLFRTDTSAAASLTPPPAGPGPVAAPSAPAASGVRGPGAAVPHSGPSDAALHAMFKAVSYDLKACEEAVRGAGSAEGYLRTILEMIGDESRRASLQENWAHLRKSIAERAGTPEERASLARLVVDFVGASPLPDVEDLLAAIVSSANGAQESCALLQDIIQPRVGPDTVRRLVSATAEEGGRKAVGILCALAQRADGMLRSAAFSCLTTLAADAALLAAWAGQDPTCVARPEVCNVIGKTPRDQLYRAFQQAFGEWSVQQSLVLLNAVQPGIDGMEQLLLAAIAYGPFPVRKAAILHLPKYPTAAALNILKRIVQENNEKEDPFLPEVEAALEALRCMDDVEARAFLDGIANERRWLRFVYRKEIRDALLGTTPTRKDT